MRPFIPITKCLRQLKRTFCVVAVLLSVLYLYIAFQFNLTQFAFMPEIFSVVTETVKVVLTKLRTVNKQMDIQTNTNAIFTSDNGHAFKLVDIPASEDGNRSETLFKRHEILWFNQPSWIDQDFGNGLLKKQCAFKNCHMTKHHGNLSDKSALVFTLTRSLPYIPPATGRPSNQVWIRFWMEPPNHLDVLRFDRLTYRHNNWRYTINWTMSYRTDSDVVYPYGVLVTNQNPQAKNYADIFDKKEKFAAWIVSNCHTDSRRMDYVNEMKEHGIQVDSFGNCGENGYINEIRDLKEILSSKYKFYFSFENSFCQDYVTEKFFRYYALDLVLVVRGEANYSNLLPPQTYIDTKDFSSSEDLANYLHHVANSRELYTSYLKEKDRYISKEMFQTINSFCKICEKLNNLRENKKVIDDIVPVLYDDQCKYPTDLNAYHRVTGYCTVSYLVVIVLIMFVFHYCYTLMRKIK